VLPGFRRAWWWTASLALHASAIAVAFVLAPTLPIRASDPPVEFEFVTAPTTRAAPRVDPNSADAAARPVRVDPLAPDPLGGAHDAQNIDTRERGERGDGRSRAPGLRLAERAEDVNLSPLLMNAMHVDQENRIDTGATRRSPQYRRSTPQPGYDPWLSLDDGVLLFRAPRSNALPAQGASVNAGLAASAGVADVQPTPHLDAPGVPHDGANGSPARPAAGVASAAGPTHRAAGPTAAARAAILSGHASTTSEIAAPRPSDDIDAEALATTLLRNSVAATIHAGATRAEGNGGIGGGGAPGSGGGHDAGGRARPYGEGDGWLSLASPDDRYFRYFQDVRRTLDPLWEHAFPHDEALRLRQGTVILRFVIRADGSVRDVAVQRRSGIDAFDRNVVVAIAGAHLPPIPAALQRSELRVTAPFVFRNPIVR
jgi:TonB family protein